MKTILLIFLVSSSLLVSAQPESVKIKRQAQQMADALTSGDYKTFVKFTYPALLDKIGGEQRMITIIEQGKQEMAKDGIKLESAAIGEPQKIYPAGTELHCLLPQTVFLKVPGGKLKSQAFLLAISKDKGQNWFFLDTAGWTTEKAKELFPDYNPELVIPSSTKPVFIPD